MRGYQRGIWLREIEAGRAVTGHRAPGSRRADRPSEGDRGALSGGCAPEVCWKLPALGNRGRREDRVRAAPAVSRAVCTKQSAHEHTGSAESIRPSLRNGFTAYIVLSPVSRSSLAPVAAPKWIDPT